MLDRAVDAISVDNAAERRVLMLKNPAFRDVIGATCHLRMNFQVLLPRERAQPHRHNSNALRFVLEGEGAETIVDGKRCPMEVGDLILTPGGSWHEHVHNGDNGRVVWLDSLDAALLQRFRAQRYEAGPAYDVPNLPSDGAFLTPGFLPAQVDEPPYSPLFRYPWKTAVAALEAAPLKADGSRVVRYTNPMTGGAVLNRMDCYLIGLARSVQTQPCRTMSNSVCFVIDGDGLSHVGDKVIHWGKYDTFTLPSWQWFTHQSTSTDAKILQITDREVMRRLGLLIEETKP